jgi:hypothetical protein
MGADYPTLNDVEPSWADINFNFGIYGGLSVDVNDIAAFKWSDKVEVGVKRGAGGRKTGRTVGIADCDASATFYRKGWQKLRDALAIISKQIGLVGFDVLIQHTPPGSVDIFKVKIVACRVLGRSGDMSESADPDKIEVPLNPMRIEEGDGITLI